MLRFPSSKILSIISRYDSRLVGFIWGVVVVVVVPFFPDFLVDAVAPAGTL